MEHRLYPATGPRRHQCVALQSKNRPWKQDTGALEQPDVCVWSRGSMTQVTAEQTMCQHQPSIRPKRLSLEIWSQGGENCGVWQMQGSDKSMEVEEQKGGPIWAGMDSGDKQ